MLLTEKFRPKTLEEFIGNETARDCAIAYMEDRLKGSGIIFTGQPGVGKTSLALILAQTYNLHPVEVNASSTRRKSDVKRILAELSSFTLDGKGKLLIIDEAEGATEDFLFELLAVRHKKILVVNEFHKLPRKLTRQCQISAFEIPSLADYETLLAKLDTKAPEEVMLKFRSFRNALNWYQEGDYEGRVIQTEAEKISDFLTGKTSIIDSRIEPMRVLDWWLYNGGDPALASRFGMMIVQGQSKVVLDIIRCNPLSGIINEPFRIWKRKDNQSGLVIRIIRFRSP